VARNRQMFNHVRADIARTADDQNIQ
jgi:hypothetical protein